MIFAPLLISLLTSTSVQAASFDGSVDEWRGKEKEVFKNPEANFREVLRAIKAGAVDPKLSDEELYRAATAGLLAALNRGEDNWNRLLSPRQLEDFQIEMSGGVTGIGATLKFDAASGFAEVLFVLPQSAALRAGLQKEDRILSVNGKHYKGKEFADMISDIRGPKGESVRLKVLRGDRVMDFKITRDAVRMPFFEASRIDDSTGLLRIDAFTNDAGARVKEKLASLKPERLERLIVDLRNNEGGSFDQAIAVASLFAKKDAIVAQTLGRDQKATPYRSPADGLDPKVRLIVLVNETTASGAELLAGFLRETRRATLIGSKTRGKWSVESLETLPNHFAIRYSTLAFETPSGQSFQGKGLKPDLEIKSPPLGEVQELEIAKRIAVDGPLKAAVELK